MRFVQTIEFQGTQEEFEASLQRYLEMIEFDSYDDAVANSNHPTTQQWAAEAQSLLSQATFRNLDVVGEYTM
jgi:hypothetical protein